MKARSFFNTLSKVALSAAAVTTYFGVQAVTWPNAPLGAITSATPMTMLVMGKDHKLFYEAYNDASDVDGDGTLDIRFKPGITYYGLFDSELCYRYSNNRFEPVGTTTQANAYKCTASNQWSGNWLNYMTTSRIDALRKVLYGGYRSTDSTTETVLERAYIPQDAHSWGKEYHNLATDGYLISDYTALSQPSSNNRRHFFGNLTANQGIDCATLNDCSGLNPLLRIRTNVGDNKRIWEWASKERPVLHNTLSSGNFPSGTGNAQNFTVRVLVCTGTYHNGCKQYPNSGSPIYKPVGLLHEYGESDAMLFGLLTGSYDQNMSGGRLRKVVSSFSDEINSETGQFNAAAPIANTINRLRIRDFNNGTTGNNYRGGWVTDRAMSEGEFVDWGNPVAEMLYEATRYFAGKKSATSAFSGATTVDSQVGLSSAVWDDPYESTSAAKAAHCARASFLTISDVNPSFDSDQVPGSYFGSFSGDLTGLDVSTIAGTITSIESNITGLRFIGQSGTTYDTAPSPKTVTSLANIRGLAPEEPTKQGSYYSASVARYAKTTDLRNDLTGTQSVDNYVVALSSPLPKIEVRTRSGQTVNVVPFAKSVGGSISNPAVFQPTNQIVDFYVEAIANSNGPSGADYDSSINSGRYYAKFRINFEDVEQGADHDMDVIAEYVVQENASGRVTITVTPTYQAGGIRHHMGYIISGTTSDGIYLVAQDESNTDPYFLDVPAGHSPGYCNASPRPSACNNRLPTIGSTIPTYTFTPGSSTAATLLKDPLWYAAKHGGFVDRNGSNTPDLTAEWDNDGDGVPDTYFLVQNPLKLRESLKKAFDNILERSGSGGNVAANSTVLSTESLVFQGSYNSENWSGDLTAYPVTQSGVSSTPAWKASENLPAPTARNIHYGSLNTDTPPVLTARTFQWATLSTAERNHFDNQANLLNYVRGVRTEEEQNGGTLRNRSANNVLGDISHSTPFHVKDSDTVFVGTNDGMLHAFNAETGAERFAYIPSAVLPRLKNLASAGFKTAHEYFVDGDTVVTSTAQTPAHNYLVATLGRGGKGLFGMEVTGGTFNASSVWEYFSETDDDLGYMLGRPVLGKMKNGDWAVLVGNGYNSADQKAVLYVVRASDGQILAKLDTGVAGDNGLAPPGLRLNADGEVEYAYAGDLHGNVWKFDFTSTTPSNWSVGTTPLFVARDGATPSNTQPITAPLSVTQNLVAADANYGKWFVHFGTGSIFRNNDPADQSMQTWYGLIDEGTPISGRSDLKEREITRSGTVNGKSVRVFEEAEAGDMLNKKGFYIDLVVSGEDPEGERIVTRSNYYRLLEPVLLASSVIPVEDVCTPGGRGYINAINPFTGGRLNNPLFDNNDDGRHDSADGLPGPDGSTDNVGSVGYDAMPNEATLIGDILAVGLSDATVEDEKLNTGSPFKGRISWREIVKN